MRANLDQDGGLNMAEAQMTSLAPGLDELTVEVARSGELPAPGSGAVLDVHATRLEIDGWVLRLDHTRRDYPAAAAKARELADRAARHLDAYGRGEAARADVDRAVEDVRALAAT